MANPKKLVCEFCGAEKKEVTFTIGACSRDHIDWCMIEGTGKMACPKCYEKASAEGQKRIDDHIKATNKFINNGGHHYVRDAKDKNH